jgi:cyclopropane fatty-acyl-phospholipid synthase-like methyltransferase
MRNVKAFLKSLLPKSFVHKMGRKISKYRHNKNGYLSITLSDEQINNGEYMKYFGGRANKWDSRGAFQLLFLQEMGMQRNSRVLDIGCGPGRASIHLIKFLDAANYYGIDNNPDFIKAANAMVEKNELANKSPSFRVIHDFNFVHNGSLFDYAIVFSVLNHCDITQKRNFFRMITQPLKVGGKVYISHAKWFKESYINKTIWKKTKQFGPDDFDVTLYGWPKRQYVFPIIELTKYLSIEQQ